MRRLTLALGLLALGGCDASETGPTTHSPGTTAVFLTDAPFPFDGIARVDIYVREIAMSPSADTAEGAPEWVVAATPDRVFNLLDLQNGATALLGEASVPPGQYRAVRLAFDPDRSTMTAADGTIITGTGASTGPGIDWQAKGDDPSLFAIVEEAMAIDRNGEDIVIDFDVGRSFLYDGAGRFTFIPFLRAITRAGSGAVTGRLLRADGGQAITRAAINVHIAPDSVGFLGPLLATSRSRPDGRFTASFLRPGRYQITAEDLERGQTSEPVVVQVTAGQTADAGELRF